MFTEEFWEAAATFATGVALATWALTGLLYWWVS
jgi:hypothetical protein